MGNRLAFENEDLKKANEGKALSRTFGGHLIDLLDPRPEDFDILDIAHHLSMICRFTGSTKRFYSVAEHSLMVMDLHLAFGLSPIDGLLHDASEAYLNDINGNLKKSPALAGYKSVEKKFEAAIQEAFKFKPLTSFGKTLDLLSLEIEGRELVRGWQRSELPPELAKVSAFTTGGDKTPAEVEDEFLSAYFFYKEKYSGKTEK